jgi:hypothetical protein
MLGTRTISEGRSCSAAADITTALAMHNGKREREREEQREGRGERTCVAVCCGVCVCGTFFFGSFASLYSILKPP